MHFRELNNSLSRAQKENLNNIFRRLNQRASVFTGAVAGEFYLSLQQRYGFGGDGEVLRQLVSVVVVEELVVKPAVLLFYRLTQSTEEGAAALVERERREYWGVETNTEAFEWQSLLRKWAAALRAMWVERYQATLPRPSA